MPFYSLSPQILTDKLQAVEVILLHSIELTNEHFSGCLVRNKPFMDTNPLPDSDVVIVLVRSF